MSDSVHPNPVAAGRTGDSPTGWLLELAAASRSVEARPAVGARSTLGSWSSRRAAARARRQLIRQEISAKVAPPEELPAPFEFAEPPQPALERRLVALAERLPAVPVDYAPVEPASLAEPEQEAVLPQADEPLAEPELLNPLLERIGAYTAKPQRLIVH